MGTTSGAKAYYGLKATGTHTRTNVSVEDVIGNGPISVDLSSADVFWSARVILANASDVGSIDMADGDTTGSTAWVAGTAQVETATAAGTITGSGNASVTVTASGMTGSPKTINVAVLVDDTAADWAEKVRTALAADADVSALFTVSGSTTSIVLTRKPTSTFTIPDGTLNLYAANDTSLNIALDNGTCTGITAAALSANTTAGVASDGAYWIDAGVDFEGKTVATASTGEALLIENLSTTSFVITEGSSLLTEVSMYNGERMLYLFNTADLPVNSLTFTCAGGPNDIRVTFAGGTV